MNITKEQVLASLSKVNDPDLKRDLVTLNMIEDIVIKDKNIHFTIVLTTPACPLKDAIHADCVQTLKADLGEDVELHINFDSRVTSRRTDKKDLLPGVQNIICVASGKGGVGKSTVSVNLALALAKNGAKVGLIDADIYGPSVPLMLGVKGQRPSVKEIDGKHYIIPMEVHGIKALSIGMLIDETQPVVWRGPMVSSALKQFVTDCIWGELDYLIIDLPPGTGDVHLTLVQTIPITGVLIVTTPQKVALADARKAVGMFKMPSVNVPILGVIENMAWFTPAELPDNKYYLFGKDGGRYLADEFDATLLGQIPLVQSIQQGADSGKPAILDELDIEAQNAFNSLASTVARQIAIRNDEGKTTKVVETTVY